MLHVRIVCPPDRTDAVLRLLGQVRGATNLMRLPGAVLDHDADLVEIDVAREAVDGLLTSLRPMCLEHGGSISLETIDTALGESMDQAEREAPGDGGDAVIWDELAQTTKEQSVLSSGYLLFLVIATFIAAVGLLTDSQVLIVGAMVLGPEFGPLAGLALAAVNRDGRAARLALRALLVGFPLAIVLTGLLVAALAALGEVPQQYLDGRQQLTAFVSSPNVFSVLVALLAGIAGTVSLTAEKSSTLVGVFISVTTVPAAAGIAAGVVTGQGQHALGAAVQLLVNLVCIVLASVLTLLVQRSAWRRVTGRQLSPAPRAAPARRSAG
jgi:uncharacterized hydrophobic protein (TIGR00271 family)